MRRHYLVLTVLVFFSLASPCYSHVKWFVEFDIADKPQAFSAVFSLLFINMLILACWGVFIGGYIDTAWTNHRRFSLLPHIKTEHKDLPLSIIRIGTGIFFMMLWLIGGTILTPDLTTDVAYISTIQLLIAIAVLFRTTLALAGIGILGLYGYAVYRYGLFHMLDYAFLLALGLFLLLTALKNQKLNRLRLPIIYGLVGFSFMWSAMEKLLYPQWFDPFLEKYPFLLMGFDKNFFLISAALVELVLFYMVMRFKNGSALIAIAANLLIISGNVYFGKVDAIGHFPANVLLLLMALVGNIYQNKPQSVQPSPVSQAIKYVFEFLITTIVLMCLYKLIHTLEYGH